MGVLTEAMRSYEVFGFQLEWCHAGNCDPSFTRLRMFAEGVRLAHVTYRVVGLMKPAFLTGECV